MSKFCSFDNEELIERQSAITSGEPDYKCPGCGRVYEMRYPASAAGGRYLELVYDPDSQVKGAADG